MTQKIYLLAIDQGTTSTRAIIFDALGKSIASHQIPFKQYFPNDAWVEHDPIEIWHSVLDCCRFAMDKASLSAKNITTIGISNQRETTLIWDKKTGEPICPAIVWQDRRTAKQCHAFSQDKKIVKLISERTGLLIDSYFSATKIAWILDQIQDGRKRAEKGELLFGTMDTFLLWKLTEGKSFFTDATNASRTLLFNIHTQAWDDELLALFNIPKNCLPCVLDSNAKFGITYLLGAEIPITGMAGDQQAATIGQACFEKGMIKSTYGTGCFVMLNTGKQAIQSHHQLLTTVAYRINGEVTYALEGSIFSAGTGMQWIIKNLKLMATPEASEELIKHCESTQGVYFVPAFTGLGAPYWDPDARAAILGITRDTQIPHIVRAALEAVCYQTVDLIRAIKDDFSENLQVLRVDGGMTKNNWLLQFLSGMLKLKVMRHSCIETSALGAGLLAGLGVGVYKDLSEIAALISFEKTFIPAFSDETIEKHYLGWQKAVGRIVTRGPVS
ncbi:MAG: glycerol kinase [Gammaproteobacteria bacterium RIFCSPHIGHO2_12_FULL_38_11]|nr:MAG: glycerol kinase [Gammaproteobacteria bacterium RIFCSPHIGHO2_12_FULL_38_11]